MPLRRVIEPLPCLPHLPSGYAGMAGFCLTSPGARADFVLILADAFEEVADAAECEGGQQATIAAVRQLAAELRRRAPDYA